MLIDTHCHINMIVKKKFDLPLTQQEIAAAALVIQEAATADVSIIINVGTSLIESKNCLALAQTYPQSVYAAVGIHPNDCTNEWQKDLNEIESLINIDHNQHIVAIGECGLDRHYPDYNLLRQKDAFKAHIELALEYNKALIVHSRDARDETLACLEPFKREPLRGIIHCFSEDRDFATTVIEWGFVLGIGGTITYPKNEYLRAIVQSVDLAHIVLETDAPFLPPQIIRGKQNHPQYIATIADYIANLKSVAVQTVASRTTENCKRIFNRDF